MLGRVAGSNEVVVDKSTADKEDLAVGSDDRRAGRGPRRELKISGFVKFGSVGSIGGATLAGFDLPTAQRLFGKEGKLDQIRVACEAGRLASPRSSRRSARSCRRTREVRTGTPQATRGREGRRTQFISFLRYFLLAFGLIALFVGAFVIVNSLSITIAQRTRELATLRTLGASRRQVRLSVVLEALVMGMLASIVGLFLGLGLAKGLFSLFDAVGFTLPNNGILLEARTVIDLARPGDPRHADRELLPGAPRDAGAADRGRPRGRGAPARALRTLPHPVRGAADGPRLRSARRSGSSRTAPRPCCSC